MISFSETQFKEATAVKPDALEDVFYCTGFFYSRGNKTIFAIRQVLNPYEFPVERGIAFVSPSAEFLCRLYNHLRIEQPGFILQVHWHKFSKQPEFSAIDDECAFMLLNDAIKIKLDVKILQVVFGMDSEYFKARHLAGNEFIYFNDIEITGASGIKILPDNEEANFMANETFEKNVLAFTRNGQDKISKTGVAVIGAGGIGSGLLYHMARTGFQNVTIIDFDRIEENNCNRLYFVEKPRKAVGKFKAEFMAKSFKKFNPKAKVSYFICKAQDEKTLELLKDADLILLAVDNDSTRAIVNSLCAQYCKPLVNISTGIFMNKEGEKIQAAGTQIQWFIPRESAYPCLKCQGSLNQKEIQRELMDESQKQNRGKAGYVTGTQISPEPQVMPLNSIGISIAMWQICCWIAGIRKPEPWTYYDAIQNKIMNMQAKQNSECSCCGVNDMSILALGDYKKEMDKCHGHQSS